MPEGNKKSGCCGNFFSKFKRKNRDTKADVNAGVVPQQDINTPNRKDITKGKEPSSATEISKGSAAASENEKSKLMQVPEDGRPMSWCVQKGIEETERPSHLMTIEEEIAQIEKEEEEDELAGTSKRNSKNSTKGV